MSTLGGRMKAYEAPWKPILPPRMPIIIRVDGRAFHTLTSGCEKPFDLRVVNAMDAVTVALCQEIAGAVMAYVQSDEVSVLVHPYKRLESQTWFGADVIKMASISACIAANGRCARKREFVHIDEIGNDCLRTEWFIDNETPRFGQDRAYVEALLATEKE